MSLISANTTPVGQDASTSSRGFPWAKGVKMNRPPDRNPNVHGEIRGVPVGSKFANRIECSEAGVHAPLRAGIHGNQKDGAFSVVLSGGYEDDVDDGVTITYTGQGGRNTKGSKMDQMEGKTPWEGPQNEDQEWIRGNKALKISGATKKPIRVVRGHTLDSRYAPAEGYRYDGLYEVVDAWRAVGKTGFKTCRFTFERLPGQSPIPGTLPKTHIKKATSSSISTAKVQSSIPPVPVTPQANHRKRANSLLTPAAAKVPSSIPPNPVTMPKRRIEGFSTPIARVPSLIPLAGPSKPVSTITKRADSTGVTASHKLPSQPPSTTKRSDPSETVGPHRNKADASKPEKHRRKQSAESSLLLPSQATGPVRHLSDMSQRLTLQAEAIHKLPTPRPTMPPVEPLQPTKKVQMQVGEKSVKLPSMSAAGPATAAVLETHMASFQGMKRRLDDDETDSRCGHPAKVKKRNHSVVNITPVSSANSRWATVKGKKKCEGIHFKKQVE